MKAVIFSSMKEYSMCRCQRMWLVEPVTSPRGLRSGRQIDILDETGRALHTYTSAGFWAVHGDLCRIDHKNRILTVKGARVKQNRLKACENGRHHLASSQAVKGYSPSGIVICRTWWRARDVRRMPTALLSSGATPLLSEGIFGLLMSHRVACIHTLGFSPHLPAVSKVESQSLPPARAGRGVILRIAYPDILRLARSRASAADLSKRGGSILRFSRVPLRKN